MKKTNLKKLSLIFVAMCLMLSATVAQVSVWDGTHTTWTNGTGTLSDPYLIENAAQLAYLAVYVNNGTNVNAQNTVGANTYWKLTADIDLNGLSWTPIGNRFTMDDYYNFGGHLDGNSHTIANLVIIDRLRAGLISMMNGGSVKNLGIVGNNSISNSERGGGFVCSVSDIVMIDNCYYTGNISAISTTTTAIAGGIVGWTNGYLTITNCNVSSNSSINSSTVAGGILGYNSTGIVSIYHCNNNGAVLVAVVSNNSVNTYAGGIVGYSTSGELSINDCSNIGDVSAEAYDRFAFTGGIVGYTDAFFTIDECNNIGNIFAFNIDDTYAYTPAAGGIIGITGDNSVGSVYRCHNMGSIFATSIHSRIGGIIGWGWGGNLYIDNCSNDGTVSTNPGTVGGIIGEALYCNVTINNCFNSSNYISGSAVGGIIGDTGFYIAVIINNCYNTGSFSSDLRAGGIIANACCNPTINNCYNTGNISSYRAGGIVGEANTSGSSSYNFTINNCYNTGDISSSYRCGGIVGSKVFDNSITVNNCYNTGTISQASENGGIVGNTNNVIVNNSYYLNTSASNSGGGVAQTEIFMKAQEFVILLNSGPVPNNAYTRDLILINAGYPILLWQDATLSNLIISEGELSPMFSGDIFEYTVDVGYIVSSVTLTATAANPNATVIGDGLKQLAVGTNLFTITVTAEDGITELEYTVIVNRADEVGIVENVLPNISVYPNPTTNQLRIKNYELRDEEYRIYNISGQLLLQGKLQDESSSINVAALSNGIYYLRISGQTVKFVKQ